MSKQLYSTLTIFTALFLMTGCASSKTRTTTVRSTERYAAENPPPSESVQRFDRSETHQYEQSPMITPAEGRYAITLEQFRENQANHTAVIIDARSADNYAKGHVRGARNVPATKVEKYIPGIENELQKDQLIIIYCGGPACPMGDTVYDRLASAGFTNMRVFRPGWEKLSSETNLL